MVTAEEEGLAKREGVRRRESGTSCWGKHQDPLMMDRVPSGSEGEEILGPVNGG